VPSVDPELDPDPYRNYPGGSPTFDEHVYDVPSVPTPQAQAPSPSPSFDAEKQLKDRLGSLYDTSILGDFTRNTSYANNTGSQQDWLDRIVNKNLLRGTNESNSSYTPNGQGGFTTGPTGKVNLPPANRNDPRVATTSAQSAPQWSPAGLNEIPGYQFNDPYSKLLEEIAQNQLKLLQNQNPQTQQLMDFLNKQFTQLSTSQGYTPDQMAVLNTQAFEPIEALRGASQQRELERTARAGYLPTSGITLDQQREIDTDFDRARIAANRDLSINAINRQDQQRQQAVNLGQLAMHIPQQQGAEALNVANLLYQLPRQAMMDANAIVNGSSPQSVVSPYIQLMQQQQQAALYQQQQQQQWAASIGQLLAGLFD
jgi:hypothetical protein